MEQVRQPGNSYSRNKRLLWALGAIVLGVLIAGFWNYKLVDGFGRDMVAHSMIGETSGLSYDEQGVSFGFLFAIAAGLGATFTACNCVVFAMLPGLACEVDRTTRKMTVFKTIGTFVLGVVAVSAIYGAFTALLGADGVAAMNERDVRILQAQITFTLLGIVLLVWGLTTFGYLKSVIVRLPVRLRTLLARPTTQAGIMGVLVGLFSVGRPFPLFREFLSYAAGSGNPFYGAYTMIVQGLAQIAVMVVLFVLIRVFFGKRLAAWIVEKPHQLQLISSFALVAGGAYFIYYWGLAFVFDIGRWGFKLNWYE